MGARTTLVVIAATSLFGAAARADQLELEKAKFSVDLGAGWTTAVEDDFDTIYDPDGTRSGQVLWAEGECDALLAQAIEGTIDPVAYPVDVTGWSGFKAGFEDGRSEAIFCRRVDFPDGRRFALLVASFEYFYTTMLVQTAQDGVERYLAGLAAAATATATTTDTTGTTAVETIEPKPDTTDPAWRKKSEPSVTAPFLPTRYELGFTRMTIDTGDALFNEQGWGATFAVERNLYGDGVPAWGYRARLSPTGAGLAGYLDGAIGAAHEGLAVMAIAGVGGAGSGAPLGAHAGFHAGIQLPNGLDLDGGYAWTADGDTRFQFEGRFFFRGAGSRAYSMGFGYESRGISSLFTLDVGIFFPNY